MKNIEVEVLYKGLQNVATLPGAKFAYAISRNLTMLKPVVEAIEKSLKIPAEYGEYETEYEDARIELCKFHAKSDDAGEPLMEIVTEENGKKRSRYVIQDVKAFTDALNAMDKGLREGKYKVMFEQMKNYQEYQAFRESECVDLPKLLRIKVENLPEGITGAQIQVINEIID